MLKGIFFSTLFAFVFTSLAVSADENSLTFSEIRREEGKVVLIEPTVVVQGQAYFLGKTSVADSFFSSRTTADAVCQVAIENSAARAIDVRYHAPLNNNGACLARVPTIIYDLSNKNGLGNARTTYQEGQALYQCTEGAFGSLLIRTTLNGQGAPRRVWGNADEASFAIAEVTCAKP